MILYCTDAVVWHVMFEHVEHRGVHRVATDDEQK